MIKIKLHDLIWQRNVRGYEVARATHLTEATISKIVRGETVDVKLSTINKLCNYFKCDLKEILEYVPDSPL